MKSEYKFVIVESYVPKNKSGLHGEVHIRPIKGQGFSNDLHVECSKKLSLMYPIGTKFKIKVKLTDRNGEGKFLYSYYGWPYEVIKS